MKPIFLVSSILWSIITRYVYLTLGLITAIYTFCGLIDYMYNNTDRPILLIFYFYFPQSNSGSLCCHQSVLIRLFASSTYTPAACCVRGQPHNNNNRDNQRTNYVGQLLVDLNQSVLISYYISITKKPSCVVFRWLSTVLQWTRALMTTLIGRLPAKICRGPCKSAIWTR